MPYFIYKIHPGKKLELIEDHDSFKEAKTRARAMRAEISADDEYIVKVTFAENTDIAEHELLQEREAPILMEHEK